MIKLWLPCIPPTATAQQKRHTKRGQSYDPPNVVSATQFLTGLLLPHSPKEPLSGPIRQRVKFIFPFRDSEKKAILKANVDVPMLGRVDCDNLVKRFNDVLAQLRYFENDNQIYSMMIEKWRGPNPGILLNLG